MPKINSYSFGKIVVDGNTYTNDVILLPDKVIDDWWRDEGHTCSDSDLEKVFSADVDVLIIGTGKSGMMRTLPEVEQKADELGIRLIVKKTVEAVEEYNKLSKEKRAAAALHLTC